MQLFFSWLFGLAKKGDNKWVDKIYNLLQNNPSKNFNEKFSLLEIIQNASNEIKIPITIENPQVVSKSFPKFWEKLNQIGIKQKILWNLS